MSASAEIKYFTIKPVLMCIEEGIEAGDSHPINITMSQTNFDLYQSEIDDISTHESDKWIASMITDNVEVIIDDSVGSECIFRLSKEKLNA